MVQAAQQAVILAGPDGVPLPFASMEAAWAEALRRQAVVRASAQAEASASIELGRVLLAIRPHYPFGAWGRALTAHGIDRKRADRAVRKAEESLGINAPTTPPAPTGQRHPNSLPAVSQAVRVGPNVRPLEPEDSDEVRVGTVAGASEFGDFELGGSDSCGVDDEAGEGFDDDVDASGDDEPLTSFGARHERSLSEQGTGVRGGLREDARPPVADFEVGEQLGLGAVYAIAENARVLAVKLIGAGGAKAERAAELTREYARQLQELEGAA